MTQTTPFSRGPAAFDARGALAPVLALCVGLILIAPPFYFLVAGGFTVTPTRFQTAFGLDNYRHVLALGNAELWRTTLAFALGSSAVAVAFGVGVAWLVARTDVPFRGFVRSAAFLSLATPFIIKGIGWILLLGPNNGLINNWLRALTGATEAPIQLFSLGGMIAIEGLMWTPIAFLLATPSLQSMDPALEEAATMAGASRAAAAWRVTAPLALPSVLAILLLSLVRALESFEVPLLIGVPGGVTTITTALYRSIHAGLTPRYGDASAYASLLVLAIIPALLLYHRATRAAGRFVTITGRGYRPSRIALGRWRWPAALLALVPPLSLLAPLAIMAWASFTPTYLGASTADIPRMSLVNYANVLSREDILDGALNSLLVGLMSAAVVAAGAFILAAIMLRATSPLRRLIDPLCAAPLALPGIVLGFVALREFLTLRWIPIYGTIWILVFVFVIKFIPYGMRFAQAGLLAQSRDLEECGRICGAGAFLAARRIALPLAAPSIAAAAIYVFMTSTRDLASIVLLSGSRNATIPMIVLDLWNNGEIPRLAALSMVVVAVVAALGLAFARLSAKSGAEI